MTLLENEPVKRAEKSLKDFDKSLSIVELKSSAKTALEAANSLNCEVGAIVKSLLIKVENSFLLCLVAGDKRCSLNKLKKIFEKKNIRMASPDEVKKQTGYTIGGVSPVGHTNKIQIFIDNSLGRFANIFAAAGHPNAVFGITFFELKKLTNSEVDDLTE